MIELSDSIWSRTCAIKQHPRLTNNIETDICVVGAGMAGILTAYRLQQAGARVTVIDASATGGGQTKNTTAKVSSHHGLIYTKLLSTLGCEAAKKYFTANKMAISEYEKIIGRLQIECDWKRLPSCIYSTGSPSAIEKEAEALHSIGVKANVTDATELPFPVSSAVVLDGQAQFHPLKFLDKLSDELDIYEHTRATDISENTVITENGKIKAQYIVIASHFPFVNMPGYYFMRLHQDRSYVIALKNTFNPQCIYLGTDDGLSIRGYNDMILLGGSSHRTGENSDGGKYDLLRQKAEHFWPESREIASWSAQDCITLDGIPYIGRFSHDAKNVFVATGFGKWGMTGSMISSMAISDMINGVKNGWSDIFSPERSIKITGAKNLVDGGIHAVKGIAREVFSGPQEKLGELEPGRGGIVEYNAEKAGVYKDLSGKIYAVSLKCPHMGCQLTWNQDEKSWDCPCHGSRFDYTGKLIDEPAAHPLKSLNTTEQRTC